MKKARGSALIIAFLLVATVGGAALMIGRLFLLDQSTAQVYEDSIVSYFAAESGIEEALLRYRYDKNLELPVDSSGTYISNRVLRTNLTTKIASNVLPTLALGYDANSKYDLKVNTFSNFYGHNIVGPGTNTLDLNDLKDSRYGTGDGAAFMIPRDEAIKIDIQKALLSSGDINLFVKRSGSDATTTLNSSLIEAKITGKVGGVLKEFKKALIFKPWTQVSHSVFPDSSDCTDLTFDSTNVYYQNKLKNALAGSITFDDSQEVTLTLKPVNTSVAIGIDPQSLNKIPMPYTSVKSTGYYGRNTRTLEAKIDRQSGTVYDLFDYVIYDKKE